MLVCVHSISLSLSPDTPDVRNRGTSRIRGRGPNGVPGASQEQQPHETQLPEVSRRHRTLPAVIPERLHLHAPIQGGLPEGRGQTLYQAQEQVRL